MIFYHILLLFLKKSTIYYVEHKNSLLTKTDSTLDMTLPTMNASGFMEMNFLNAIRNTSNNYNEIRDRTLASDKLSFREISISFTVLSIAYHDRMMMNNDNDGNTIMKPIDSF